LHHDQATLHHRARNVKRHASRSTFDTKPGVKVAGEE